MNGDNHKENLPAVVGPVDIDLVKSPDEVIEKASRAATALKKMIDDRKLSIRIGNKEHIYFEAWQTAGILYGITVKTFDAQAVEVNGVKGVRARASVYHKGIEIGGAEAFCLCDEANWKDKPLFQLASMAQTRAGSKALKNVLSWVIVLAGYSPTPAEEMIGGAADGATKKENPSASDNSEVCSVCNVGIPPAVSLYSKKNFGRFLCRDHQSNAANR